LQTGSRQIGLPMTLGNKYGGCERAAEKID
jgi:hypothetical protein